MKVPTFGSSLYGAAYKRKSWTGNSVVGRLIDNSIKDPKSKTVIPCSRKCLDGFAGTAQSMPIISFGLDGHCRLYEIRRDTFCPCALLLYLIGPAPHSGITGLSSFPPKNNELCKKPSPS